MKMRASKETTTFFMLLTMLIGCFTFFVALSLQEKTILPVFATGRDLTPTPTNCAPGTNDIDCDGLENYVDPDSDGDGTHNGTDTDDDNDGIPDHLDSTPGGPSTNTGDWTENGWCNLCPTNTPTFTPTATHTFTPTATPTKKAINIKFFKHPETSVSLSTVDSWISTGNTRIMTNDGTTGTGDQDAAANAKMVRVEGISDLGTAGDGLNEIDGDPEKNAAFALLENASAPNGSHKVFIADPITNVQGAMAANGVAFRPGTRILIVKFPEAATLAHEMTHNLGEGHTLPDSQYSGYIMYPTGVANRKFLRISDKLAWE